MTLMATNVAEHEIVKKGLLEQKGNLIPSWKSRWVVLTLHNLYIFKNENEYTDPTEIIELSTITSISAMNNNQNQFCIKGNKYFCTYFKCDGSSEQQEWINIIEGYRNLIRVPVTVSCEENKNYCCEFELEAPYNENYKYQINTLTIDAVKFIQRKYHPIKFYATNITQNSFIEQNVYDWRHCDANIIHYTKQKIISKGLSISINIANNLCKNMITVNDLCPIYAKMRYQGIFSEEDLSHLFEYNHFENAFIEKSECKYAEKCHSYNRLLDGGDELKDRVHVKLFRHHRIAPLHTMHSSADTVQADILKNAEILSKINDKLKTIDIKKWENARNYAVLQIMTLADSLEKVIRDVGISKTAGGGAAMVGGVLSVSGLVLAPVSGGTSLGLTVAGTTLMVAGGVTSLISDLVKTIKENGTMKKCIDAYEYIQPDTRKIAFLLDDYDVTFNATRHNISIFSSLSLGASAVSNIKTVYNLIGITKVMKGYNALKLAANFTEAGGIQYGKSVLFGGAKFGQTIIYETGSVLAKSIGWIGGGLSVVAGIWEIMNGIKTIKDAENAIHQFRMLAITINTQTETLMDGYNKISKLY